MSYKVFLSHSSKDMILVNWFYKRFTQAGYKIIIAARERPTKFPGYLAEKLKNLIKSSDCVVALLTRNGVESNLVNHEVAYTLEKKPLIPIVDGMSVNHNKLGFLQGTEYINLRKNNNCWQIDVRSLDKWLHSLRSDKETSDKIIATIVTIGLFGAVIWLSRKS